MMDEQQEINLAINQKQKNANISCKIRLDEAGGGCCCIKSSLQENFSHNVSCPDASCDGMERVLLCSSHILLLLSLRRQILGLDFSGERGFARLHRRGLCQRSCGSFTCAGTRPSFTTNLIKTLISSCMLEPAYLAS